MSTANWVTFGAGLLALVGTVVFVCRKGQEWKGK